MKNEDAKTFQDLEQYLRQFKNFSGDSTAYDFCGVFQLFLAVLDNLVNHSLDADVESLGEDGPCLTEKQRDFLRKLG